MNQLTEEEKQKLIMDAMASFPQRIVMIQSELYGKVMHILDRIQLMNTIATLVDQGKLKYHSDWKAAVWVVE